MRSGPLLAAYDPALLLAADREFCHGELRQWTMLLEWLATYGATPAHDAEFLRQCLAKALNMLLGEPVPLP